MLVYNVDFVYVCVVVRLMLLMLLFVRVYL